MIAKDRLLWIYTKMNEIRKFEEKAWKLFEENKLRGSVHLYIAKSGKGPTLIECKQAVENIHG